MVRGWKGGRKLPEIGVFFLEKKVYRGRLMVRVLTR